MSLGMTAPETKGLIAEPLRGEDAKLAGQFVFGAYMKDKIIKWKMERGELRSAAKSATRFSRGLIIFFALNVGFGAGLFHSYGFASLEGKAVITGLIGMAWPLY